MGFSIFLFSFYTSQVGFTDEQKVNMHVQNIMLPTAFGDISLYSRLHWFQLCAVKISSCSTDCMLALVPPESPHRCSPSFIFLTLPELMSCICIQMRAAFDSHDSVCFSSQSCRDAAGVHAFGSGIKDHLLVCFQLSYRWFDNFCLVSFGLWLPRTSRFVCWLLFISIFHHFSDRSTCACNPLYMHHDAGGEAKCVTLPKLLWCSSHMALIIPLGNRRYQNPN